MAPSSLEREAFSEASSSSSFNVWPSQPRGLVRFAELILGLGDQRLWRVADFASKAFSKLCVGLRVSLRM